jgi:hypothetical protein
MLGGRSDHLVANLNSPNPPRPDEYFDNFVFEGAVGVALIAGQDKVTDHDLINTFRSVDGKDRRIATETSCLNGTHVR